MKESFSRNTLLWLVAIGFFMETLDSTIVNTAIPTMALDLGVIPLEMQSVVISYTLTLAVFIPASGWLTDRFGIRRVYLSAIIIFTFGSLLCALSPTLSVLVFARILQAAGGSMLLPVGRLAVLRAFPGERYLPALSFVTMPALIGPLIGPTLGGLISEKLSWHWIFLVNIPIGILGCFATYKAMPADDYIRKRSFDFLGFLQMAIFMVCVSLALEGMTFNRISSSLGYFLFIFGIAALAAYIIRAHKIPSPLISLKLFEIRTFSMGILGNIFSRLGSTSITFLLPLFMQLCLGLSPLESGMAMLPIAIAAILGKRLVSPLVQLFGYKKFLITNTFLVGASIASFTFLETANSKILRISLYFLFGIFNSMQFTAMNTMTMKDLTRDVASHGNTLFSIVQMMAMSFSIGIAGSLIQTLMNEYSKIEAFHLTFICMGALTWTSAWIFFQIGKDKKFTPG